MKIWDMVTKANDYENLERVNEFSLEWLQSFDGRSHKEGWIPEKFNAMDKNKPWGDIASYHTHIPIVTKKVLDAIMDLVQDTVEVLPVYCEGKEWYLVNVLGTLDCIDYSKAIPYYFPNSTRIMMFEKYAFYEERVRGKHMFKIKEQPLYGVFVSDELKQRIENSGLKGFKFELVWDSEVE